MTTHKPTDEQQAVIDAYTSGNNLVVEAVAGAGKTTTLKMAAAATPDRGCLYVAYNKDLAKDAKKAMPSHVECRTSHSLAYAVTSDGHKRRLGQPRPRPRDVVEHLYRIGNYGGSHPLNSPTRLTGVPNPIAPATVARLAGATVEKFCQTGDAQITAEHVPWVPGVVKAARSELVSIVVPVAELYWADIANPHGQLRFGHDHYLKIWAMTGPKLPADGILFDEAQDANGVLAAVLKDQGHAQQVAVGDANQQLYAWRGSIDALSDWPADQRLTLSQSFRFGPAIAEAANEWLHLLRADTRVIGAPWIGSQITALDVPEAVLCRTNVGAVKQALTHLDAGFNVHIVGGCTAMAHMATAAMRLMNGQRTDHPDLLAFTTWGEVLEYASTDEGADLGPFTRLVEEHGPEVLLSLSDRVCEARKADVIVSTAHKSKGRQWKSVSIGDDFKEPRPRKDPDTGKEAIVLTRAELMLAYVAVTRAEFELDNRDLSWASQVYSHGVPVHIR